MSRKQQRHEEEEEGEEAEKERCNPAPLSQGTKLQAAHPAGHEEDPTVETGCSRAPFAPKTTGSAITGDEGRGVMRGEERMEHVAGG